MYSHAMQPVIMGEWLGAVAGKWFTIIMGLIQLLFKDQRKSSALFIDFAIVPQIIAFFVWSSQSVAI